MKMGTTTMLNLIKAVAIAVVFYGTLWLLLAIAYII